MKSRGNLLFGGGVVLILAAVVAAYYHFLAPGKAPPPPPPPEVAEVVAPKEQKPKATLVRVHGAVEIRTPGSPWQPAAEGAAVGVASEVRTNPEGTAALEAGENVRLDISPNSRFTVERLDANITRVRTGAGVIVADAKGAGQRIEVAAEGSDAVATTEDGRLHVLNDGQGNVQAAVTRGDAVLTSRGKTVTLSAGFQSRIRSGQAPSQPTAIPKSMLLKVKWPEEFTGKRRHLITGTANPGSLVRIGGKTVTAGADGKFRARVTLKEGNNRLRVYAIDVLARKTGEASPPIVVDTKAPEQRVETDPDMWRRKEK